jgi:uncharacterized membrane protein
MPHLYASQASYCTIAPTSIIIVIIALIISPCILSNNRSLPGFSPTLLYIILACYYFCTTIIRKATREISIIATLIR